MHEELDLGEAQGVKKSRKMVVNTLPQALVFTGCHFKISI